MLLRFCEKARVIGISVTATLPTVIENFDLDYLQTKTGDSFRTISGEDFSRLSNDFKRSQSGYDKIKIHSELLGASGYSVKTRQNIFNDKATSEKIYNMLDISINDRELIINKDMQELLWHSENSLNAMIYALFCATP